MNNRLYDFSKFARDASFEQGDHPRDENGKFTAGGMNSEQHHAKALEHWEKEKQNRGEAAWRHREKAGSHSKASMALSKAERVAKFGRKNTDPTPHLKEAEKHAKVAARMKTN